MLDDVRMVVATDSSAILGIGDQGWGGLAIAIGKLALYTVAGGVSPYRSLPVGARRRDRSGRPAEEPRVPGRAPEAICAAPSTSPFMDQFRRRREARWPRAVIQWEDLSKDTAFDVLERYRKRIPSFNDDIQGTGAVALAGLVSACALRGESSATSVFVLYGAGAGGAGVAWAIEQGMVREGLSREEARARLFVLDSKGLLVEGRPMEAYKHRFARPRAALAGWGDGAFDLRRDDREVQGDRAARPLGAARNVHGADLARLVPRDEVDGEVERQVQPMHRVGRPQLGDARKGLGAVPLQRRPGRCGRDLGCSTGRCRAAGSAV